MALKNFVILYILGLNPHLGMTGLSPQLRVLRGNRADVGEFPFMTGIFYKGNHSCGGTILSDSWIMTAAHCVYGVSERHFCVLAGTTDLRDSDINCFGVDKIIVHEAYGQFTPTEPSRNDIAVLKLIGPLPDTISWLPVTLATSAFNPDVGADVKVVGWGRTADNKTSARFLKKATIKVLPNDECTAKHKRNITVDHICTGSDDGGVALVQCKGDSGGPVLVKKSTQMYQVGISTLTSTECGSLPSVSTRVSNYISWIEKKTGADVITTS